MDEKSHSAVAGEKLDNRSQLNVDWSFVVEPFYLFSDIVHV